MHSKGKFEDYEDDEITAGARVRLKHPQKYKTSCQPKGNGGSPDLTLAKKVIWRSKI